MDCSSTAFFHSAAWPLKLHTTAANDSRGGYYYYYLRGGYTFKHCTHGELLIRSLPPAATQSKQAAVADTLSSPGELQVMQPLQLLPLP
jgi:hypothetical protein